MQLQVCREQGIWDWVVGWEWAGGWLGIWDWVVVGWEWTEGMPESDFTLVPAPRRGHSNSQALIIMLSKARGGRLLEG